MAKRRKPAKSEPAKNEPVKSEPVTIAEELRRDYGWFDDVMSGALTRAVRARRMKASKEGPVLTKEKKAALVDEYDLLAREIDARRDRQKEIAPQLLADWGRTGEVEMAGTSGSLLIALGHQVAVSLDDLKPHVDTPTWRRITKRTLDPEGLLLRAASDWELSEVIAKALEDTLRVQLIPPYSRKSKGKKKKHEAQS